MMRTPIYLAIATSVFVLPACSDDGGGVATPGDDNNGPPSALVDSDGDGLPNALELELGSNPEDGESPFPGGSNDSDNGNGPGSDAIPDGLELYLMSGGASLPVTTRSDTDGDGIPDYAEVAFGLDPFDADAPYVGGANDDDDDSGPAGDDISDGLEQFLVLIGGTAPIDSTSDADSDGISDVLEILVGMDTQGTSNPNPAQIVDVDKDGIPDYFELSVGYDPDDVNDPVDDGASDVDDSSGPSTDLITDALEHVLLNGGATAPITQGTDSDADGVPDWAEVNGGSNPFDVDSPVVAGGDDLNDETGPFGDGVSDAWEETILRFGGQSPVDSASDTDGDGIADVVELESGSDLLDGASPVVNAHIDTDEDGVPDYFELTYGASAYDGNDPATSGGSDTDSDGISDALEALLASIGAESPTSPATDSDSDGLPDYAEVALGSNPLDIDAPSPGGGDSDEDGLSDAFELYLTQLGSTAPITAATDSDSDAAPDYSEVLVGSDPFDLDSPLANGMNDSDGDGLSDSLEFILEALGATPPIGSSTDTDADGAPDYFELLAGDDVFDSDDPVIAGGNDSDGDGLSDALEAILVAQGATAPVSSLTDSDLDGAPDYLEVFAAASAFDIDSPVSAGNTDSDLDGLSDALETLLVGAGASTPLDLATDSDADSLPDYLEAWAAADLADAAVPAPGGNVDTDGDGVSDALEAAALMLGATAPVGPETDVDGDGIPFYYEVAFATNALSSDSPLVGGANSADTDDATGPAGDGVSDALEALLISQGADSPLLTASDADADGLPDYLEVRAAFGPFDPDSPLASGANDTDGDGLTDALESFLLSGGASNPAPSTDTDGDGISDVLEVFNGTDPFDAQDTPATGAAPTASSVAILGTPSIGQVLSGLYIYVDGDNDPEGATSFRWLRSGIAIAGETTQSYTVTVADAGATISFEVTPRSVVGIPDAGSPSQADLVIPNQPPTVESLVVIDANGGSAVAGDILMASYMFSDVEGDLEGASTFRWMVNGAQIPGAVSSQYTLQGVDLFDGGVASSITVEVTPVAATGTATGAAADATIPTGAGLPPSLFGAATVQDVDGDGQLGSGDTIIVPFDQRVDVVPGVLEDLVPGMILALRQDLRAGTQNLFASEGEAASFDAHNAHPETATKYSIMDQLEDFRDPSGRLRFRMTYHDVDLNGLEGISIEWYQTSNPLTHTTDRVTGFDLIATDVPGDTSFGGLAPTRLTANTRAFFNGQPITTNWWWSIGANTIWPGAGGLGVPATLVPQTSSGFNELRVMAEMFPLTNAFMPSTLNEHFGTGATFSAGPRPNEVTIVLGTNPTLMLQGVHGTGAATGLCFNRSGAITAIQSLGGQVSLSASTADLVPTFTERPTALGNEDAYDVAAVDINGDGFVDLVSANGMSQPGRVFINDGTGGFTLSGQSLGSSSSRAVAAGDLNGDGFQDVFIANDGSAGNSVYLNDMNGMLTLFGTPLGSFDSRDVQLGDLDGDLDLDAVVMNGSGQGNMVYINDGLGNLVASPQSLGEADSEAGLLVDIDGDSDLDLVVANSGEDENALYLGNGDGTFIAVVSGFDSGDSTAVAAGDVDDDGELDLLFAREGLGNALFLGDGSGSFVESPSTLSSSHSSDIALFDVDGDGSLDLYAVNRGQASDEVFFNDGQGSFVRSLQGLDEGARRRMAIVDLDGDGDSDVVIATSTGCIILEGF